MHNSNDHNKVYKIVAGTVTLFVVHIVASNTKQTQQEVLEERCSHSTDAVTKPPVNLIATIKICLLLMLSRLNGGSRA